MSSLSSLQQRVISACILAPIAIAALYFGDVYFLLFLAGAAAIMSYEWCRASLEKTPGLLTFLTGLSVITPLLLIEKFTLLQEVALLFCSAIIVALVAVLLHQGKNMLWAFLGPLCIGLPVLSLLALRAIPETGFALTFGLFLVIWATDIGAYFSGKTIGGPKIVPAISPNKTWAGLIGGMIAATVVAYGVNALLIGGNIAPVDIIGLGAMCAILAQTGDFAESAWKRRFGIKDASNLIPGHGGVMDRLDGVFLTAPSLLLLIVLSDRM